MRRDTMSWWRGRNRRVSSVRDGHRCGVWLSRRVMTLKFSLLRGPKTSINAIFHPQPPFSISRLTESPAANDPL